MPILQEESVLTNNFEKDLYLLFSFSFMPDQDLECRDCGATFAFTEGEQLSLIHI